jgi:hypothetical protein
MTDIDLTGWFDLTYRNPLGLVEWMAGFRNGVTVEGVNHFGNAVFRGGPRYSLWYVGLIDQSGFSGLSEEDTHLLHPGWSEYAGVTGSNRVLWQPGAASGGLMASAVPSVLSITADGEVRGAFLASRQPVGLASGAVLYSTGRAAAGLAVEAGGTVAVNYSVRYAPRG